MLKNSAFNAQGLETNYNSCCTGKSSENICTSSGGAQEKEKTGCVTQLPPKLVEKLVFCKIFIPSYTFDALLC